MAIFSLAVRTTNTATASAATTLSTAATTRANILEFGTTLNTGVATAFGLGHQVAGTTLGGTANGQPEDMASPQTSPTVVGTTWATQPTTPTQFYRRVSLPATIGAGIIWTFPRGILVPVSNNIGSYNIGTVGLQDTWFVWDE